MVATAKKTLRARPRNAAATRQAILESARRAFTRRGYDGVGVREIAGDAGVTAMLVNRYFGSKELLFEEVVELTLSAPGILTKDLTIDRRESSTLGARVAAALVAKTAPEVRPMDGFLILLRSASNDQAAKILRKKFVQHFAKPLSAILPGHRTAERAAIFLAVIAGFQVMRQIIGLPALVEAEPSELTQQLQDLFDILVASNVE
jgi:AcrR family transcriptional regulator